MALIATIAALAAPTPAVAPPDLPAGCGHLHPAPQARTWLRRYLRSDRPYVDRGRVRHARRCVRPPARARPLRKLAAHWYEWRHQYGPYWRIRFNRLSPWDRNWAIWTGACESGNNPRAATGNGFYGAHQWLPSTWAAADHSGLWVTNTSWHHQAVVAVRWRNIAGRGQWPNCG